MRGSPRRQCRIRRNSDFCGLVSETRSKEASRMSVRPKERHRIGRIGWLRPAVLGANDGILSTASLVLGVATAHATHNNVLVAGVAGLVAGAMSEVRWRADSNMRAMHVQSVHR